jgi:hypothetical protein
MLGQVGFDSIAEEMVNLSEIVGKERSPKPLIAGGVRGGKKHYQYRRFRALPVKLIPE